MTSFLELSMDDFANHPSVLVIKNIALKQSTDFSFEPASISLVAESLANLNTTVSACPDGSLPKVLKLLAYVIARPLTKLFNYCITSCVWPSQWKLSNVTPVYKKEDETSKTNYRPSIILSASSFQQSLRYLNSWSLTSCILISFSPLFSDNMSGFLHCHSCCNA